MKNSRAKGSSFELEVAKAFSETFGVKLRRTPLSGGWSHSNPNVAGDLVCVTDGVDFPYCVECKNSEGWTLESLFTDNHKWLDRWWLQTIHECPPNKIPLLVFTKNRSCAFIAMTSLLFDHITSGIVKEDNVSCITLHYPSDDIIVICRLEEFLRIAVDKEVQYSGGYIYATSN